MQQSRPECDEYIQIFYIIFTNIHSDIHLYQFLRYEYIRTFVRFMFDCTNIFGYSLVSVLECKNCLNIRLSVQFLIQIFIWTFVLVKFVLRIHSDIRFCQFVMQIYSCQFLRMPHSDLDI